MNSSVNTAIVDIGIGGMTCASCVSRVERALKKVPGVTEASVNIATESARITFAPAEQMEAQLRRAVRNAGYEPRTEAQMEAHDDAAPWAGFAPVAVGLLLSAPLVLPMVGDLFGRHWMLPAWVQFLLATPVQFVLGARFYKAGWHSLKALTGNMDLLVAIGTTAGWALSTWLWLTAPSGALVHLYFEGSAVVVTLVQGTNGLRRAPSGRLPRPFVPCTHCSRMWRTGLGSMVRWTCPSPRCWWVTAWWSNPVSVFPWTAR